MSACKIHICITAYLHKVYCTHSWVSLVFLTLTVNYACTKNYFVLFKQDGASALIVASCQGHTPVVRRLLHAKANPDQKNKVCT